MFVTKLDWQLVPVLMFCSFSSVFPVPCLSREEGVSVSSSASTLQVGFMYRTTSPTPEERLKSQGRGRMKPEARCSGVPLGSSARF